MSWFTRKKSFVEGSDALATDLESEFGPLAEGLNGLFKRGTVSATSDLTTSTSYQDVPGATLNITPTRASRLLVWASFDLETGSFTSNETPMFGTVNLDGSDQAKTARLSVAVTDAGLEPSVDVRETVSAFYDLALAVGAHTVKLRAKHEGAFNKKCYSANTYFTYLLIPDPEP